MAAIIELKYFNTFWLKKIKSITDIVPNANTGILFSSNVGAIFTVTGNLLNPATVVAAGQQVTIVDGINTYSSYVVEVTSGTTFVAEGIPSFTITGTPSISFGKIINFDNIPQAYNGNNDTDWLIEESRIRGGYNNTSVDYGVKAYLVEDEPNQQHRRSSLIHSGIFNSRTGINQTNQFSVGEDITRTIDPANGSIQKLYAEDTNLIIFQENKVSKSLIDKDAIYSAEGNASVTSRNLVIGQNVAYAGEYGISTDPESFAVNGYRKYFTDRDQNVVCRLSMDGITVISAYGMTDYFRDKLSGAASNIIGGWDAHNKQYVVSLVQNDTTERKIQTLAFDETSKGWTSFFDYVPNQIFSLNNNYFTAKNGKIYQHYELAPNSNSRSVFYGLQTNSKVTVVFNGAPSMVKNFQTINYEGDSGWRMDSFKTNTDLTLPITSSVFVTTLEQMQNSLLINRFKLKEDKYYADLVNGTPSQNGEVVWGSSSSGVKGFFGEVTMSINNSGVGKKELFAVSTGFVRSS
jgi:hypothetical protein